MTERHDIILGPVEDGPNPPDLLKQIVEDVKKLVPEGGQTARKWVRAKGDEAEARVREIQARVYKEIAELDMERQKLVQQRNEAEERANIELLKHRDDRKLRERQLRIEQQRQRTEALHEVVAAIVGLEERGIHISMEVIGQVEKAMKTTLKK